MKSIVKSLVASIAFYLALFLSVGYYSFNVAAAGSSMQTAAHVALLVIAIGFVGKMAERVDAINREKTAHTA